MVPRGTFSPLEISPLNWERSMQQGGGYLSKLPENCPVCGGKIENGLLSAKSKDGTAEMQWRSTGLEGIRARWTSAKPTEILKGFRFGDFEAIRCLNCNLVILSYVKEVEYRRP
jgi:hypothetical protein